VGERLDGRLAARAVAALECRPLASRDRVQRPDRPAGRRAAGELGGPQDGRVLGGIGVGPARGIGVLRDLRRAADAPRVEHAEVGDIGARSEEHTSELQSRFDLVCRLLLEKKKGETIYNYASAAQTDTTH